MPKRSKPSTPANGSSPLGYKAKLWQMADALRRYWGAPEYEQFDLRRDSAGDSNSTKKVITGHIEYGDTVPGDLHPDLKADFVLANPPLNDRDWRAVLLKADERGVYGVPPAVDAHLAPLRDLIGGHTTAGPSAQARMERGFEVA